MEPSRIVQDLDTQSVSLADTLRRELGNVVEEAVVRTLGWGRFPKQVPVLPAALCPRGEGGSGASQQLLCWD